VDPIELVVATRNRGKLREIKEVLKLLPFQLRTLQDIGFDQEIIEDKLTFKENALLKATTVANKTVKLVLADDSGLEVDALGGKPGIFSARYAGENASDHENNLKLLEELNKIPEGRRTAKFRCAMVLASPDKIIGTVEGACFGSIGFKEVGSNGFGYDPLFILSEYNKTFGELDSSIKNKVSHRAKALEKISLILESYISRHV